MDQNENEGIEGVEKKIIEITTSKNENESHNQENVISKS
jgi:hypothetical protein